MFAYLSARRGIDPGTRRGVRGRRGAPLVRFRPQAVAVSCLDRAQSALREAKTTGICSARLAQKAESGHEINTVCCSTVIKLARLVGQSTGRAQQSGQQVRRGRGLAMKVGALLGAL